MMMMIILCCRLTISHTGEIACPLEMGPTGCSETSVTIYHYKMRNNPEEQRFHPYRGGTLKSRRILPDYINLKHLYNFFFIFSTIGCNDVPTIFMYF